MKNFSIKNFHHITFFVYLSWNLFQWGYKDSLE